jgi:DNA invertase Pin-like site-specific DNA recombinase
MDASAEFTAVDNPHANKLTVHIAAVAQHELEMIGERTKAALQAAKARGVKLGRHGDETLAPRYQQEALQRATTFKPVLQGMLAAGSSFRDIAKELIESQGADAARWQVASADD